MDKGMNRGAMWGLLALVLAIGLMGSALVGGSALAARGSGGHKSGGTPSTPTGVCAVTPNPVAQWELITITGSGFVPNNSYGYDINGWMGFVTADATGSFSKLSQAPLLGTDTVTFSNGTTCTFQVS